jgi:hypothetical protein
VGSGFISIYRNLLAVHGIFLSSMFRASLMELLCRRSLSDGISEQSSHLGVAFGGCFQGSPRVFVSDASIRAMG